MTCKRHIHMNHKVIIRIWRDTRIALQVNECILSLSISLSLSLPFCLVQICNPHICIQKNRLPDIHKSHSSGSMKRSLHVLVQLHSARANFIIREQSIIHAVLSAASHHESRPTIYVMTQSTMAWSLLACSFQYLSNFSMSCTFFFFLIDANFQRYLLLHFFSITLKVLKLILFSWQVCLF